MFHRIVHSGCIIVAHDHCAYVAHGLCNVLLLGNKRLSIGLDPDLICYNIIINDLRKGRKFEEALNLLDEIRNRGRDET